MYRFQNYDEYMARISQFSNDIIKVYVLFGNDEKKAIEIVKEKAGRNYYNSLYVFQDEDARHFNHDIAKECQRRLNEIGA